jgi:Na+-driven multidrug efflux pump
MRWVIGLGTDSIIGNQVMGNLAAMPFMVADSFAVAMSTLSGIRIGEKNIKGLRMNVRYATGLAVGIGSLLSIVFFVFGRTIIGFYVQDAGIISHTYQVLSLYVFIIPIQALGMVISGSLWGQGQTKWTATSMLIGVGILRPVIVWILMEKFGFGLSGYWIAVCIDELIRCGFVFIAHRIVLRRQGLIFAKQG